MVSRLNTFRSIQTERLPTRRLLVLLYVDREAIGDLACLRRFNRIAVRRPISMTLFRLP